MACALEAGLEDVVGIFSRKLYKVDRGGHAAGKAQPEFFGTLHVKIAHFFGDVYKRQPLGVDDFVKKSSFLYYTREALGEVAPRIADFAERECLHAHARSVTIRYEK